MTGQLPSPRFSGLISAFFMSYFYQATVLVKWKPSINSSYPPLLSAEEITINIYIPIWLEKKKQNCLEDIKNLLGLSGLDSVKSTVIHKLSKTKLSKTICPHIHQMPPRMMKNSQSEHLSWLGNRKGLMNLDMTSVV